MVSVAALEDLLSVFTTKDTSVTFSIVITDYCTANLMFTSVPNIADVEYRSEDDDMVVRFADITWTPTSCPSRI